MESTANESQAAMIVKEEQEDNVTQLPTPVIDASMTTNTTTHSPPPNPTTVATTTTTDAITADASPISSTRHNSSNVILPLEEFAEDLDRRLGRANGNIFIRKPGVPNVHDGQIMVRLKKKRFIIIDYSIVPTAQDSATAALSPQILCPHGAGEAKCTSSECTKIGVPVMLYDSDPEQPSSLYLRSGLCFSCQRILNEKRRTQRKRKSDVPQPGAPGAPPVSSHHLSHLTIDGGGLATIDGNSTLGYHSIDHHAQKRFRLHGEILDLNPDAIIINGPLEGTKHHGPGYEYAEISADLQVIAQNAHAEMTNLVARVSSLPSSSSDPTTTDFDIVNATRDMLTTYEKSFLFMSKGIFLLSQWKSSWDSAVATATAEKAAAAVAAAEQQQVTQAQVPPAVMIGAVREGNAVAQTPMLEAGAIADAVASAAAVAAAQQSSVGDGTTGASGATHHHEAAVAVVAADQEGVGVGGANSVTGGDDSNMIPLLLAANAKNLKKEDGDAVVVESVVVGAQEPDGRNPSNTTTIFTV